MSSGSVCQEGWVAKAVQVTLCGGGGATGALPWVSITATCMSNHHWGMGAQGAPMMLLTLSGAGALSRGV